MGVSCNTNREQGEMNIKLMDNKGKPLKTDGERLLASGHKPFAKNVTKKP